MKKRIIATVLAICLSSNMICANIIKAESTQDSQVIYNNGIAFEVKENEEGLYITGEYEGSSVEIFQGNEENNLAKATIIDGDFSEQEYSLVMENVDVDIDELYDRMDETETIKINDYEDLIDSDVIVYNDQEKIVDVIALDDYEGQAAVTIAVGGASYWLLSAAVSAFLTYETVRVVQSVTKKNTGKTRGEGKVIDSKKVPNKKKKNKTVTGKNLPREGEPNSSTDLINENTGKLSQRRFYDDNGDVTLDVDFSHGGNHKFPHVHIWY